MKSVGRNELIGESSGVNVTPVLRSLPLLAVSPMMQFGSIR